MLSRILPATVILSMTLMTSLLGAAETSLISGVSVFKDEWIESATKSIVEGPGQDAKALRIELATKPKNEWQAQTWTRALAGGVETGDTVVITFQARSIEPATGHLKVTLGMADAPYTPVVSKKVVLTSSWQTYEVKEVVSQGQAVETLRFGFTFGDQAQTFEIADLTVVNQGK
jgi:hypothetical protein